MNEFRKDYALNRWVLIAEKRKARPHQFEAPSLGSATDFFAPGNEKTTPPEIGRVEYKGSWMMRWFANKFPAVALPKSVSKKIKLKKTKKNLLQSISGYGHHEVIVETPTQKQLWDLTEYEISELLKVYKLRFETLSKEKNTAYISIFKNHGSKGGTSLIHSHSQIITTPFIPPYVEEKVNAYTKNVFDKIIDLESKSKRTIKETTSFLAFAPYASRFNFESWIVPKDHKTSIDEFDDKEIDELARIMKKILGNLKLLADSYNILLFYDPKSNTKNNPKNKNNQGLRFHIEITPRSATWAGFENATDVIINAVSPETAAKLLKK